ncbi:hypothetical protein FB451DRAFT_1191117 [Mycena latifolia]|nr:hypothetical protein FB451DRAFT_1191117 [Mycena latifolia]
MSSDTSDFSLCHRLSPDELKRQQHAEGQARYRERSQAPAVGNNLRPLTFRQDSREDARAGPRANEKRVSDRLSLDEVKRQQHAEAQARYRERNLEKTRELARERMKKHREKVALTSRATWVAAIKRRDIDADYRERQRKNMSSKAKALARPLFRGLGSPSPRGSENSGVEAEEGEGRTIGARKDGGGQKGSDGHIVTDFHLFTTPDFKGSAYHDRSRRLNYYLLWDFGVFTTRAEAENIGNEDDIKIYFKYKHAKRRWAQLCRRFHCAVVDEDGSDFSGESDDDNDLEEEEEVPEPPPMPRPVTAPAGYRPMAKSLRHPAFSTPGRVLLPSSNVRSSQGPSPRTTPLPLFREDDDDEVSSPPSRKDETAGLTTTPVGTPLTKRRKLVERGGAPPSVASSTAVSSASSLSPSPSPPASLHIGASVSSDPCRLKGAEARKHVGVSSNAGSSSIEARKRAGASTNAAMARSSPAAPKVAGARLLYNYSTRKVYKSPALAMEEMQSTETVQVFEYEDLMDYLSAAPNGRGSSVA